MPVHDRRAGASRDFTNEGNHHEDRKDEGWVGRRGGAGSGDVRKRNRFCSKYLRRCPVPAREPVLSSQRREAAEEGHASSRVRRPGGPHSVRGASSGREPVSVCVPESVSVCISDSADLSDGAARAARGSASHGLRELSRELLLLHPAGHPGAHAILVLLAAVLMSGLAGFTRIGFDGCCNRRWNTRRRIPSNRGGGAFCTGRTPPRVH